MKKVGVAIILLTAVVGVSYLNAVRNEAKNKRRFEDGFERGTRQSREAISRADSIATAADRYKSSYADSLKALKTASQAEVDSLHQALALKDQEVSALKERSKPAARPRASARKSESIDTSQKHTQILDFYRRKLSGLPKDLSDAERKLAVDEIREETARKFSVSTDDLNKIRQDAHLAD